MKIIINIMQSKENKYFAPFNLTVIFFGSLKRIQINQVVFFWVMNSPPVHFVIHSSTTISEKVFFFHFGCIQLPCCISFKEISSIDWFDCACHRFDEPFIIHRHDHFVFRLTHQKLKNFCNVMRIETKKIHTEKRKEKIKAERKS